MLKELSVGEFLSKLSSEKVPGSGSAAALVGACGVSLLLLALQLCSANSKYDSEQPIQLWQEELTSLKETLEKLIDEDAVVLEQVLPLFLSPMELETKEWNRLLAAAMSVSFATADACFAAMEIAKNMIQLAEPNLVCDIRFAALNCHTALQGSMMLNQTNIDLIREQADLKAHLNERVSVLLVKTKCLVDLILDE
jgi:formiminotetrahydrofolate cyclodeaminase